MEFGIKILQSQAQFINVLSGKFIQNNEVIVGIKEKSLQVFTRDEENPAKLTSVYEQLFYDKIISAAKIVQVGKDLVCVTNGTELFVYEYDEESGNFEKIFSDSFSVDSNPQIQNLGIKLKTNPDKTISISALQDKIWVYRLENRNLLKVCEIDTEAFNVDFDYIDNRTLIILNRSADNENPLYS